jgi:hypothetical protein
MDSSLDVTIAEKQIGPDVEAAIGDTSWPMWSLVPGEDSSTGNVMGGRKLARYVLEAAALVAAPAGRIRPVISRPAKGDMIDDT